MTNNLSRRFFLAGSVAASAVMAGLPALALTTAQARALIDRVVAEINAVINSGRSERQMYTEFRRIFTRYADVPTIARSTLGPDARNASSAQMRAYVEAFSGYISRKYGKRFREFIGGELVVQSAEPWKSHFQVFATAFLRGEPPFQVIFRVSDRSGRSLFFDMLIEGISLLKTERQEIQAMLDRRRGDFNAFVADLQRAG